MPQVDFSAFPYMPSLLCGDIERMAYEKLRDDTKDGILPIFELSRRPGNDSNSLVSAIELVREIIPDRPFILDIDKRAAPAPYESKNPSDPLAEASRVAGETAAADQFNGELNSLLRPEDGFGAWRALAGQFPNAVPVLQMTNLATQVPEIMSQAAALSSGNRSIAVRVRQAQWEGVCAIIPQIIAILPSAQHLLIIFDCGQGRSGLESKVQFVAQSVDAILNQFDVGQLGQLAAVCMSNSYAQPGHDDLKEISNYDWQVWRGAREIIPLAFGDYAATSRTRTLSAYKPFDWRATIVHSRPEIWDIYRHPNAKDADGFVVGAQAIVSSGIFQNSGSWCDQLISAASLGNIAGVESPRFWHAARTNGHIEAQLPYASSRIAFADLDDLMN